MLARELGRYLVGMLLVGLLVVGGVWLRIATVATTDDRTPTQAIVVLGAAQYNGKPSPVYRARLDHARELYRAGVAPLVVTIGGGQHGDRTTEGASGKKYLADRGIAEDALLAVPTGSDTLTSLEALTAVLAARKIDRITIVTDPPHAHRAELIARDFGLTARLSPVSDGPATQSSVQTRYYQREILGTLYYLAIGGSSGQGNTVIE